ncbi:MAG TPA: chromosome segregation SMC family protein [Xanthobacteraceae bacterium]|nr:chromosome segregation SMC family protein [Xanthobacteraceae bacterium]
MKLKRLRLIGFKSFVEPADFLIEPGLTGVVGPNGCGKSNLVEALRWVMGEASHKAMRAAGMDDVIFSGNNSRPGRNSAEVAITIDNATRTAPAQFNNEDTLEVSRRIEREEGSTYRLNGREVRARDIQMLFADASTGARSPALVHQGRIGEIIQAKPEQRRRVLEEAAGISGLHARRHEAELRLRAAEQNLARLEDVIGQLAGQIDALKRQARQAVRYRTLSQNIRKAEASLFHLRLVQAKREVDEAAHAHETGVREVADRTAAQAQSATNQAVAAANIPALRDGEAAAAAALARLINAREALEREEARAKERIAELGLRLVQLGADVERERKQSADAEAALARLSVEQETLAREAAASAQRRTSAEERANLADTALAADEKIFAEVTAALADMTAKRTQLDGTIRDNETRRARIQEQLAQVTTELDQLMTEAARAVDVEALAAAMASAQAAVATGETDALRAEAAHSAARQALDVTRQPLSEVERNTHRLETEAKTLARLLHVDNRKLWPPAIDLLTVDKGYETALGAALGDDLDAPVEPAAPMHWGGAPVDPNDPALPEGVQPLSGFITAAPDAMMRRLKQIGVVARADGARLARDLKPGQRLVSQEGDMWRWDGYAVAAHAPTGAARRLAGRNRLADIEAELRIVRADLYIRRESVTVAEAEVAATRDAENAARMRWRDLQHEAEAVRDRYAAAERELNRITSRRSALVEAQARLTTSVEEADAACADAAAERAALPPSSDLEARLAETHTKVADDRRRVAEVRAEAQALARELELTQRRLAAIASEAVDWKARRDGAATQIATIEARLADTKTEHESLADAPQLFEAKRRALIGEIEAAETARREAADRLAEGENMLATADRIARAALEALSAARETCARAEERHEALKRRLADLATEIREILDTEPETLASLAGFDANAPLPDIATIEAELDKLKRDRERLGAVNLRAEEELREVEAQHTTLTSERDDLIEAIKRLRQGIQSLNREARERLLSSFEVVSGHFQRLFTDLFGGGTAELQLIEHDDPLEAGLEILAKPPGKKPATLSLLSGGEQALTALALIFAVFLTNPAPICVLDEVDAPLDDHNVDRFCDLLDQMAKSTETRFIIITHNPITMARMDRLFGVTMAERGVSQLVSVDLEDAVKIREREAVA